MRKLLLLYLCATPLSAGAFGEFEQVRQQETVRYANGDTVEVSCRGPDTCSLSISHHGSTVVLEESDLDGLVVLPRHLALVGASVPGRSVVEVEIGCATYAEAPPAYVCMAQLEIRDAKLVHVYVFKRTSSDSNDAVPFRASP